MKTQTKINYVTGDATDPQGPGMKIIGHCCNNLGVWGAGFVIALSQKWAMPEKWYQAWAGDYNHDIPLGHTQFVPVEDDIWVANIIGQYRCGQSFGMAPIRYEALAQGFRHIRREALQRGASVHLPRLGAGLAGGQWSIIEELIDTELSDHGVDVTVYDLPRR